MCKSTMKQNTKNQATLIICLDTQRKDNNSSTLIIITINWRCDLSSLIRLFSNSGGCFVVCQCLHAGQTFTSCHGNHSRNLTLWIERIFELTITNWVNSIPIQTLRCVTIGLHGIASGYLAGEYNYVDVKFGQDTQLGNQRNVLFPWS